MPSPASKDSDVIVVDLGSKRRKQIKQLRKGKGKLIDRVKACIDELKASGTITGAAVPIVIVVKEKAPAWDLLGAMGK